MNSTLDWRPSDQHRRLLAAIVGTQPNREALATWHRDVDFESLDTASYELLALLSRQRSDDVPLGDGPDRSVASITDNGTLRGFRRRAFYVNTLALGRIESALAALDSQGVRTVLAGGLAAIGHYPDLSCRALPDCEILVAAADVDRALSVIQRLGWSVAPNGRVSIDGCPEGFAIVSRLRGIEQGTVLDVDQLAVENCSVTGTSRRALARSVMVVEVSVAAVWPGTNPPVRWVVDLHYLLSDADGTVAIVRHASRHSAAQLTRTALTEARSCGVTGISKGLLARLAWTHSSTVERAAVVDRALCSNLDFIKGRTTAAVGFPIPSRPPT